MWPAAHGWWNAQGGRTKLAVAGAALFALASMLNLASAGIGRLTTHTAAPAIATASGAVLTQEAAPPDAGHAWVPVKVWQGSGPKDTEDFTVGEHWRVDWIFSPGQAGGLFQVFIYHSDGRLLMNLAANSQKGGSDTSFWLGPGKYFLRVNSSGGDWKLDVQDLR